MTPLELAILIGVAGAGALLAAGRPRPEPRRIPARADDTRRDGRARPGTED